MNSNLLLGIVAFIAWSIFGTWYYVTQIKDFDDTPIEAMVSSPSISEEMVEEVPVESVDSAALAEPEPPEPIAIDRVVRFQKDSKELINPSDFSRFLDSIQSVLSQDNLSISVVGHTCDLGSDQYNLALGEERAEAIKSGLSKKLAGANIATKSKGETEPLLPNTSEENRKANRRVTINITSEQ